LGTQITNPQIAKIYGLQIAIRNCNIWGSFVNMKKSSNLRICNLRNLFANLFEDRPPLVKMNLKLRNLQGKNLIIKKYFILFPAPAGCLQYFTSAGW
jgi:hypothetical protein